MPRYGSSRQNRETGGWTCVPSAYGPGTNQTFVWKRLDGQVCHCRETPTGSDRQAKPARKPHIELANGTIQPESAVPLEMARFPTGMAATTRGSWGIGCFTLEYTEARVVVRPSIKLAWSVCRTTSFAGIGSAIGPEHGPSIWQTPAPMKSAIAPSWDGRDSTRKADKRLDDQSALTGNGRCRSSITSLRLFR